MDYKPHLYRTEKDIMVIVEKEETPDIINPAEELAAEEDRLVRVSIYGEFPYEQTIQDYGVVEIDEPINDWTDIEEVGNKLNIEMKDYLGEMDMYELSQYIPEVQETWKIAGCYDFDIEIRNPWADYAAYNHGTVMTINIPEKFEELNINFDNSSLDELTEDFMCEIKDLGIYKDWQLDIIKNEVEASLEDYSNELKYLGKDKDIDR